MASKSQMESILDEINQLEQSLTNCVNENRKTKYKNVTGSKLEILKLQHCTWTIKNAFDQAMNVVIKQCENEISKDESCYNLFKAKIGKQRNNLENLELKLQQCDELKDENKEKEYNKLLDEIKQYATSVCLFSLINSIFLCFKLFRFVSLFLMT